MQARRAEGETVEHPRRRLPRSVAVRRSAVASVSGRRLAGLAGAVALLALGAALLASTPGDHPRRSGAARSGSARVHPQAPTGHTPGPARVAAPVERPNSALPGELQGRTPAVPVSPAAAAALESEGHRLLGAGQYSAAIDHLLGAIRASGQSLAQCEQPATEACLTFAYALYDLGRALRLAGDPGAAIPVLKQRLRIDNQRPVVRQELDLARSAGA